MPNPMMSESLKLLPEKNAVIPQPMSLDTTAATVSTTRNRTTPICSALMSARDPQGDEGIEVTDLVQSGSLKTQDCILCGTCVDTCPKGVLRYSFSKGR